MTVNRRLLPLIALAFTASACGSYFTFTARPMPGAIAVNRKVNIAPATFVGLRIDDETYEEYMADEDAEELQEWEENKAHWATEIQRLIAEELRNSGVQIVLLPPGVAPADGLVVLTNIYFIEPGFFVGIAQRPSLTRASVTIYDAVNPNQILYSFTGAASHNGFAMAQRVGNDVETLGEEIGSFLAQEYAPQ
jgi:hypothetical protein